MLAPARILGGGQLGRNQEELLSKAMLDGLLGRIRAIATLVAGHRKTLWWLHSAWALLFGVGVMWLGRRNFSFFRIIVFHISFIWVTSLLLPGIVQQPWITPQWSRRVRVILNYIHKNFYQQLLFFVLPVYYGSATWGSSNMFFVLVLAFSAFLSTLDIVYDEHLSVRWSLFALFFALNLFACINVLLPVLWGLSNAWALRFSVILAVAGFATIGFRVSNLTRRQSWGITAWSGLLLLVLAELGRSFIPPVPLQLGKVDFGTSLDREALHVSSPLDSLPAAQNGRVYALTAIKAPLGLEEKVGHRWYIGRKLIFASPFYSVVGGRQEGFRLWTSFPLDELSSGKKVRIDVVTEGRQLIGRAVLPAR